MKPSMLLTKVRKNYVANIKKHSPFICVHVDELGKNYPLVRYTVLNHIRELLDDSTTLGAWLLNNSYLKIKDYPLTTYDPRMIATRLAWLDDMIKHFKSKGL